MAEKLTLLILLAVILSLIGVIAILLFQLQKMTNKLMSRNFYDYTVTERLDLETKTDKMNKANVPLEVKPEDVEDIGYLGGIT